MGRYNLKPEKPTSGTKKFKITSLLGASCRWNHIENDENCDDSDFTEDGPENTGKYRYGQSLSLKELNDVVKSKGLDEGDVHFTVRFSDDYVCLGADHIKEMNDQEQLEEYEVAHAEWQRIEDEKVQRAIKENEQTIARLQKRTEELKKK